MTVGKSLKLVVMVLSLGAQSVLAGKSMSERLAACGPGRQIIANATIGGEAHFSITSCPAALAARVPEAEPLTLEKRQTCTSCPCSNGSFPCYCSAPGQAGNELLILGCSGSTPVNASTPVPVPADCTALAGLIAGAPASPGLDAGAPPLVNGFYSIPRGSILAWSYKGCALAFFNDVAGAYGICAADLGHTVKALAGYCSGVDNIDGQFRNNPFMSVLVYNPAELS